MAISNANVTKINKMNRASQNVSLGTVVQELQNNGISGSMAVSLAQESASAVVIYDALYTKGIYLYQISKPVSGSNVSGVGFRNTRSGGSLTIVPCQTGGSFVQGDIINYFIA